MQGNGRCVPAGAMHLAEVLFEGPRSMLGPAVSPVRPSQDAADPLLEVKVDEQ